ncbi:hypothetical protein FH972_025012 [Carpinus fangiana]|uniref:BZIP domain-containing protein n=1 Tax=Carpinus fangiana TaxID=176857 RepID=A0A5N6L056_9ROSI|nr:hypothetical protein FH972_025012 [Carpinus fangiana]
MSPESASQAARNREKQRASRARKLEHTQALEEKVRRFEREGVCATVAVQTAARQVAQENRLLRELLWQQGFSEARIDEYLRASKDVTATGRHHGETVDTRFVRQAGHESQKLSRQIHKSNSSVAIVKMENGVQSAPATKIMTRSITPSTLDSLSRSPEDLAANSIRPEQAQAPPILEVANLCTGTAGKDETSCMDAAMIIASMRGQGRVEDILPELGCKASEKCYVKNSVVFNLAQ